MRNIGIFQKKQTERKEELMSKITVGDTERKTEKEQWQNLEKDREKGTKKERDRERKRWGKADRREIDIYKGR